MNQRAHFERALRAECLSNKWFAVHVQKNECGFARLGIIASKRVMPKAVSRNFVKRTVREVFRCNFSPAVSLDVLVKARRPLQVEAASEGRAALLQLLQTAQTKV